MIRKRFTLNVSDHAPYGHILAKFLITPENSKIRTIASFQSIKKFLVHNFKGSKFSKARRAGHVSNFLISHPKREGPRCHSCIYGQKALVQRQHTLFAHRFHQTIERRFVQHWAESGTGCYSKCET